MPTEFFSSKDSKNPWVSPVFDRIYRYDSTVKTGIVRFSICKKVEGVIYSDVSKLTGKRV